MQPKSIYKKSFAVEISESSWPIVEVCSSKSVSPTPSFPFYMMLIVSEETQSSVLPPTHQMAVLSRDHGFHWREDLPCTHGRWGKCFPIWLHEVTCKGGLNPEKVEIRLTCGRQIFCCLNSQVQYIFIYHSLQLCEFESNIAFNCWQGKLCHQLIMQSNQQLLVIRLDEFLLPTKSNDLCTWNTDRSYLFYLSWSLCM